MFELCPSRKPAAAKAPSNGASAALASTINPPPFLTGCEFHARQPATQRQVTLLGGRVGVRAGAVSDKVG